MTIIVRTLSGQIFDIVLQRILDGTLGKGETIPQDALAKELGVSKIPLREALVRLEHEGFLGSRPNHGWYVQHISADQAEELYLLRLAIEPRAAAFAARLATHEDR